MLIFQKEGLNIYFITEDKFIAQLANLLEHQSVSFGT